MSERPADGFRLFLDDEKQDAGGAFRPAGRFWPDLPKGSTAIGPHLPLASEELLAAAKAEGLAVHVWTVNEPEVATRLARGGAASVISDVPGEIGPAVREVTGEKAPLEIVTDH